MLDTENEFANLGTVSDEPIDQEAVQPDPVEAPEVAQAAPVSDENARRLSVPQSTSSSDASRDNQRRYTQEQQERNFAELRRLQDQKNRELELMRREIDQLRQSQYKPQPKDELPKDSLTEVHHVEKIVEARLREQEERYQRQLESDRAIHAERSLNAQYKDLYQVLSPENLRRLEQEEPELAASIASNPDTYSAKVAAYKQIKKLGITEDNYNSARMNERLAQNLQRPKNPAALAPRQGSQALQAAPPASGFADTITDDMAARHRKEMEEAISRM